MGSSPGHPQPGAGLGHPWQQGLCPALSLPLAAHLLLLRVLVLLWGLGLLCPELEPCGAPAFLPSEGVVVVSV